MKYGFTQQPPAEYFQNEYKQELNAITQWLEWINREASRFNDEINWDVPRWITERKKEIEAASNLITSLGIPIRRRPTHELTFMPSEIRRKPPIAKSPVTTPSFQPEPMLPPGEYKYILQVIQN